MYVENRRTGCGAQLIVAALIAVVSLVAYFSSTSTNPITGETQHVDLTAAQEIALGLQAAHEMTAQYGGEDPNPEDRQIVSEVGQSVVRGSDATRSPYRFQFHALAADRTINAFALPGGQIFITRALLTRLRSRGQLAAVLGHEIGHVVARHSAEQIAKTRLTQGLTGAAVIASYDPRDPASRGSAAVAILIGQLVDLKFSRNDENEADALGVRLMAQAGYDPRAMVEVMEILRRASGPDGPPEFFATHPNPENRAAHIRSEIARRFPHGVPAGLIR